MYRWHMILLYQNITDAQGQNHKPGSIYKKNNTEVYE